MMDFNKTERRVLICGAREWADQDRILRCVRKANETKCIDLIIEGECRGADMMGRCAAEECGILIAPFPARWMKYGRAAGPIRNQQMLDEGKPTEVWAFHNDITKSTGTKDMIARACKAHLKVWVISETSWRALHIENVNKVTAQLTMDLCDPFKVWPI